MSEAAIPSSAATSHEASPHAPAERDELDDVLDLLTHRLKVDPELRLEVRQELRSHLEESIAQFHLAGQGEWAARAEAVAALGDPQLLATSLWQANRRRIRLRAAAAWGARLLLPPLAVILLWFLAHSVVVTSALAYVTLGQETFWIGPPPRQVADHYHDETIAAAPADVRALFSRDRTGLREQAQLRPDDHALYAQYAAVVSVWLFAEPYHQSDLARTDPAALSEGLAVFAEGERREPDNALYPFLTAAALLDATTNEVWDKSLTVHRPSPRGEGDDWDWCRLEVTDPARFAAGLEAFGRAAHKHYYRSYTSEVKSRMLSAIPARRLADLLLRLRVDNSTAGVMSYYLWQASNHLAWAATDAAAAGRADQAELLLRNLRSIKTLTAQDYANTPDAVFDSDALAYQAEARIRATLGDAAGAKAAWKKVDEILNPPPQTGGGGSVRAPAVDTAHAGILYATLIRWRSWSGRDIDFAPMRRAEYALADELGVAALSVAVLTLATLYAARSLASFVRRRRRDDADRPLRLTLGWRRISTIVALAVIAPMIAYFAYTRLTPLSGRGWGLNVQLRRVALEYIVLGALILMLLNYLTRRAVRARAAELGLRLFIVHGGNRLRRPLRRTLLGVAATLLALLCLAGVISVVFGFNLNFAGMNKLHATLAAALMLTCWLFLGVAVMTLRHERHDGQLPAFLVAGIVARTAFPIAVLAAIILGIAGFPLHWAESHAVRQAMAQQGAPLAVP